MSNEAARRAVHSFAAEQAKRSDGNPTLLEPGDIISRNGAWSRIGVGQIQISPTMSEIVPLVIDLAMHVGHNWFACAVMVDVVDRSLFEGRIEVIAALMDQDDGLPREFWRIEFKPDMTGMRRYCYSAHSCAYPSEQLMHRRVRLPTPAENVVVSGEVARQMEDHNARTVALAAGDDPRPRADVRPTPERMGSVRVVNAPVVVVNDQDMIAAAFQKCIEDIYGSEIDRKMDLRVLKKTVTVTNKPVALSFKWPATPFVPSDRCITGVDARSLANEHPFVARVVEVVEVEPWVAGITVELDEEMVEIAEQTDGDQRWRSAIDDVAHYLTERVAAGIRGVVRAPTRSGYVRATFGAGGPAYGRAAEVRFRLAENAERARAKEMADAPPVQTDHDPDVDNFGDAP